MREFFVVGGALQSDAPSYVERPADHQLREHVQAGELCYVLTTRQMGKSSLVARTATFLQDRGITSAIIDLTLIGRAPIEEWYLTLLDDLQSQLPVTTEAETWWEQNSTLTPVRRFTKYIQEVVASEVEGQVAVFIDEVDSVLNLDFADDFFAAIRALYNRGSFFSEERRVSFVLLGVAAPDDLIKDQSRTPFNIGTRIKLEELARRDAEVLIKGLPGHNANVLERIFYWTSGHPYLTQKIGAAIAGEPDRQWTDEAIDKQISYLFLTDEAIVQENNLQFVQRRILSSPNRTGLLRLYRRILDGNDIRNNEQSSLQNELKLYGLVRAGSDGRLEVRNRIYEQVFNKEWIQENDPVNWWRRVAIGTMVITLLMVAGFIYYWQQRPEPDDVLAQSYISGFNETTNPTLRLANLANLFVLDGYVDEAQALFNSLSIPEQMAIMESASPDLHSQVRHVVAGTYTVPHASNVGELINTIPLMESMIRALGRAIDAESRALRDELRIWLQGRAYLVDGVPDSAEVAYDLAIEFNADNPATRFERALALSQLGDYESAVADLTVVWGYGASWERFVLELLEEDSKLRDAAWVAASTTNDPPPFLSFLSSPVPPATSTVTSTLDPTAPPATATDLPPTETSTVTAVPATESPDNKIVIGQSGLGEPLEVVRLGDGPVRIMLVGGLSAGFAPGSVELAQTTLDYFTDEPNEIPEEITLYILASANPDSIVFPGELTGRLNANGVDLNRNWDCNWASDTRWRGRVYPDMGGTGPFSEPETSSLADFIQSEGMSAVIFWTARAQGGLVSPGQCDEVDSSSEFLAETYAAAAGYRTDDFEYIVNVELTGDAVNWLDSIGIAAVSVLLPGYDTPDWLSNRQAILTTLAAYAEMAQQDVITPSPTATRRATVTPSPTRPRTATPTSTVRAARPQPTARPTITRRPTATPTRPSPTPTLVNSPEPTTMPTVSPTASISVTLTISPTAPIDITSTPVITVTPGITVTPEITITPEITNTPELTSTPVITGAVNTINSFVTLNSREARNAQMRNLNLLCSVLELRHRTLCTRSQPISLMLAMEISTQVNAELVKSFACLRGRDYGRACLPSLQMSKSRDLPHCFRCVIDISGLRIIASTKPPWM